MRDYELTVIINPQVEEDKLTATIEKIGRWITEKGGNIVQIGPEGKRKLAYPIKKFVEGNYVLARFQGEPEVTKKLEANLKMSEEIIRYLLVRVEK